MLAVLICGRSGHVMLFVVQLICPCTHIFTAFCTNEVI
jgi:hypothetical protein